MNAIEQFTVSELFHDLVISSMSELDNRIRENETNNFSALELQNLNQTLTSYYQSVVTFETKEQLIPKLTVFFRNVKNGNSDLDLPKLQDLNLDLNFSASKQRGVGFKAF